MENINKIIHRVANSRNLNKVCDSSYVCFVFNELFKKQYKAVAYKSGDIYLESSDSLESQEIYFKQRQILEKLNQKLGKKLVNRIKFRIKAN
ncbi:MAG: DUF721 domain-containing protein [Patescibacteria group bacterium]|nr:DUF721 domain-containing protein [Patescibacteria group bacterium]